MEAKVTTKAPTRVVSKSKKPQICLAALIRHGERADCAPRHRTSKAYIIENDPPLTDKGIIQAFETGTSLKKFLTDDGYTDIVLECSPFIRCMMTAAGIAKALGIQKIKVNYQYCELLAVDLYEECPLKDLTILNMEKSKVVSEYLEGIDYEDNKLYHEESKKLHPETRPEGKVRIR